MEREVGGASSGRSQVVRPWCVTQSSIVMVEGS